MSCTPFTQWFCWSLSLLNGYFIGNIPNIFRQTSCCWKFCVAPLAEQSHLGAAGGPLQRLCGDCGKQLGSQTWKVGSAPWIQSVPPRIVYDWIQNLMNISVLRAIDLDPYHILQYTKIYNQYNSIYYIHFIEASEVVTLETSPVWSRSMLPGCVRSEAI